METPYTLLTLPTPLNAEAGRIHSSAVYTLHGSRKRKRHEIAVGIDGESVNVYSIENQTLQSAYAIPPQTVLCCPPASYYLPADEEASARRHTYVVLRDGTKGARKRLARYTEQIHTASEFRVPKKTELALVSEDILKLDVLPSQSLGKDSFPRALLAAKDGEIMCISDDMSAIQWTQSVITGQDDISIIEDFSLLEVTSAQKGLLRGRADINAMLNTSASDIIALTCVVIRKADTIVLRLHALFSGTVRSGLQHLDDIILPGTGRSLEAPSIWHISAATGQLYQLQNGLLYVYELTSITPRLVLTLQERGASFLSYTPLSASLLLATTKHKTIVYDTRYGSIQASIAYEASGTESSKKRKRDEDFIAPQALTPHWFDDIGLAVIAAREVVGIQIKPELYRKHGASSRSIRLSAVIGKSAVNSLAVTTLDLEEADHTIRRREKWRIHLKSVMTDSDSHKLEAAIKQEFSLSLDNTTSETQLWDLEDGPFDLGPIQKSLASDLLSKLFRCDASHLQLSIPSRNVIRWLFVTEALTAQTLSNAHGLDLTYKDIAQSLAESDQTFTLLQDVLVLSIHLPIQFIVECLRLLIRSLDTKTRLESAEDTEMTELPDAGLDIEAKVAEAELSNALATLHSGLEIRSTIMQLLFGRLHAFPKKLLTKHLRKGLQLRDQIFFIHLLRIELADAGWTRTYLELGTHDVDSDLPEEATPSDRAIRTIGNLLVAVVDAVGPSGWLVGLSTDEDEQYSLIDALNAEISASLEGVYEAQTLRAYLDDFERYTLNLDDKPLDEASSKLVIKVHHPFEQDEATMMPLGGRSSTAATVQSSKKGKLALSNALTKAKQKEKMVGQYQFEQIRV